MDLEPSDDDGEGKALDGGVAADFAFAEAGDLLDTDRLNGVQGGLVDVGFAPFNSRMSCKASASCLAMSSTFVATFWGDVGLKIKTKQHCGIPLVCKLLKLTPFGYIDLVLRIVPPQPQGWLGTLMMSL